MSESAEGVNPESPKQSRLGRFVEKFFHRASESTLPISKPQQDIPRETVTEEVEPQLNPPDILENETDEMITQTPIELAEKKEEEKLKPTNRVFFHATPTRNLPSIIRRGLIGEHGHDIMGKGLLYSITFEEEFNAWRVGRPLARQNPVTDFSLTIWKASPDIKKALSYSTGKPAAGQFSASAPFSQGEHIPVEYVESGGSPSLGFFPEETMAKLRKVSPDNFLAAIGIDGDTQRFLARCQVEFHQGLADANSLEQRLNDFLSSPGRQTVLTDGYAISDLAHDIIGRIEQEVILYSTKIAAQRAEERIKSVDLTDKYMFKPLIEDLAEVYRKAGAVNEPTSRRYLDACKRRLNKLLEAKGVSEQVDEAINTIERINTYGGYELWGGTNGRALATKVGEELGVYI